MLNRQLLIAACLLAFLPAYAQQVPLSTDHKVAHSLTLPAGTLAPFNGNTAYVLGDLVTSSGATYISLVTPNQGNAVSDTSKWAVFSAASTPITSTTATPLAAGATPTANFANGVLTLGIPAGATGAQGPPGSGASDATTSAKGSVQLAGDLSGTATAPVVSKIGGQTPGNIITHSVNEFDAANAATTAVNALPTIARTGKISDATPDTANNAANIYKAGSGGDTTCPTPTAAGQDSECYKSGVKQLAHGTGSYSPEATVADIGNASNLPDSGVSAGTYGDSTHIPVPVIDAKGRVTGITTVAAASGSAAFPNTPLVLAGTSSTTAAQAADVNMMARTLATGTPNYAYNRSAISNLGVPTLFADSVVGSGSYTNPLTSMWFNYASPQANSSFTSPEVKLGPGQYNIEVPLTKVGNTSHFPSLIGAESGGTILNPTYADDGSHQPIFSTPDAGDLTQHWAFENHFMAGSTNFSCLHVFNLVGFQVKNVTCYLPGDAAAYGIRVGEYGHEAQEGYTERLTVGGFSPPLAGATFSPVVDGSGNMTSAGLLDGGLGYIDQAHILWSSNCTNQGSYTVTFTGTPFSTLKMATVTPVSVSGCPPTGQTYLNASNGSNTAVGIDHVDSDGASMMDYANDVPIGIQSEYGNHVDFASHPTEVRDGYKVSGGPFVSFGSEMDTVYRRNWDIQTDRPVSLFGTHQVNIVTGRSGGLCGYYISTGGPISIIGGQAPFPNTPAGYHTICTPSGPVYLDASGKPFNVPVGLNYVANQNSSADNLGDIHQNHAAFLGGVWANSITTASINSDKFCNSSQGGQCLFPGGRIGWADDLLGSGGSITGGYWVTNGINRYANGAGPVSGATSQAFYTPPDGTKDYEVHYTFAQGTAIGNSLLFINGTPGSDIGYQWYMGSGYLTNPATFVSGTGPTAGPGQEVMIACKRGVLTYGNVTTNSYATSECSTYPAGVTGFQLDNTYDTVRLANFRIMYPDSTHGGLALASGTASIKIYADSAAQDCQATDDTTAAPVKAATSYDGTNKFWTVTFTGTGTDTITYNCKRAQ